MIAYMKKHKRYVKNMLEACPSTEALAELMVHHERQIARMQHERMAHLITTLFVCLFFLLSFGWTITHFTVPYIALSTLLLVLAAAYLLHYYRLENGVQSWYRLSDEIRVKLLEAKQGHNSVRS